MEISNTPLENHRNWLELPSDVTLMILKKLPVSEIFESAQSVCKLWYTLCKEPFMWRTIRIYDIDKAGFHLHREKRKKKKSVYEKKIYTLYEIGLHIEHEKTKKPDYEKKMLYAAIDRSNGGLIDLDIQGFCPPEVLSYAVSRSSQLKRLRLARCRSIPIKALVEALEKLSVLEEIELSLCLFPAKETNPIFYTCPTVKTFKFNKCGSGLANWVYDGEALAIAAGMPKLRHLQLIGNNLSNVGLTAILDGCCFLQSIDLRVYFHLDLDGDLGKRLTENIKDIRYPGDSADDYINKLRYQ